MILVPRSISIPFALTAFIVTGTSYAQAQDPIDPLIKFLDLPVDKENTYYNKVGKFSIREECFKSDAIQVACNLRIMATEALMDVTYQGQTYTIEVNGNLIVTSGSKDPQSWTRDNHDTYHRPIVNKNPHRNLSPNSALVEKTLGGEIIQNDIATVVRHAARSVTLCSNSPVNDHRVISVCLTFGDKSVEARASIKAFYKKAVGAMGEAASRPLDVTTKDEYYLHKYAKDRVIGMTGYIYPVP
jgi:hypothetical protein